MPKIRLTGATVDRFETVGNDRFPRKPFLRWPDKRDLRPPAQPLPKNRLVRHTALQRHLPIYPTIFTHSTTTRQMNKCLDTHNPPARSSPCHCTPKRIHVVLPLQICFLISFLLVWRIPSSCLHQPIFPSAPTLRMRGQLVGEASTHLPLLLAFTRQLPQPAVPATFAETARPRFTNPPNFHGYEILSRALFPYPERILAIS